MKYNLMLFAFVLLNLHVLFIRIICWITEVIYKNIQKIDDFVIRNLFFDAFKKQIRDEEEKQRKRFIEEKNKLIFRRMK